MWHTIGKGPEPEIETEAPTNQTVFGSDNVLFTDPAVISPPATAAAQPSTPKKLRKVVWLLAGLAAVTMVLMLATAMLSRQQRTQLQTIKPSPTPTAVMNADAYTARLNELQQDFVAADPSQQQLPFPPVSLNLTLDPPPQQ